MSARLPSGAYADVDLDYHSFWDFLMNKGDASVDLSSIGLLKGYGITSMVRHGF